ncbi:MAG: hypothetical protein ACKVP3_25950 [Hyphomicrobiaceae bacterium]
MSGQGCARVLLRIGNLAESSMIELIRRLIESCTPMAKQHRALPDAAYAFTDLYGGVENALRETGFCKEHLERADADWAGFAKDKLGEGFFEEVQKSGLAKTLIEGRPRKQMKEDLVWKPDEARPITNVTELIVNGVCQVRNHIDHRQKFRGDEESQKRDFALIADAHQVLELVLKKHPDLKEHL